jgi:3-methyladenine DNA glycosylase/8-oxoguanine DNA glycosylase
MPNRDYHSVPFIPSAMNLPYDRDISVQHLRAADPRLALVIDRAGPCRLELETVQDPFAALAQSIVYQQLTGKAAGTIHGRLVGLFKPARRLRPESRCWKPRMSGSVARAFPAARSRLCETSP